VLVSVVIPTFNPGPDLDAGIASLVAQTLPPDEFEIVIVDDGSTDDTPAHLDELATRHSNVVVVHSDHSGWAGRPRNIGIRQARGEYVQFMDQDDQMAPDALRRLVDMGRRNHSDVVLGKVVSDFRTVAPGVYRDNREACTIHDAPVIDSLTPHKMFRRAFLLERGLEFPEGKRRLEDQLFVVKAYFAARVISILADEPCYFYLQRTDRRNAGATPLDPDAYFGNLREVLEVVIANTEPGERRARLIGRFCRTELVGRLSRRALLGWDAELWGRMFANVRSLMVDFVDDRVLDDLDAVTRVRADLIIENDPDALLELARRTLALRVPSRIEGARWDAGRLKIGYVVEIEQPDGTPLLFDRVGDRFVLGSVLMGDIRPDPIDVTADLKRIRATAFLRERATSVEWPVSTRLTIDPTAVTGGSVGPATQVRLPIHVVATLDPELVAGGRSLPTGDWVLMTRLAGLGVDITASLGGARTEDPTAKPLPPLFRSPDRLITLRSTATEGASVAVARVDGPPTDQVIYRPPTASVWRATAGLARAGRRAYARLPSSLQGPAAAAYRAMRTQIRGKR